MIDLSVNKPVEENIDFDMVFNALWADIEQVQHGLHFDSSVLPTTIEVTPTGKAWFKNILTEVYETACERSIDRPKHSFVRCNTDDESIITDIVISKAGMSTRRQVVSPTIRMAV